MGGEITLPSGLSYSYQGLTFPGQEYMACQSNGSGTWNYMVPLGNTSGYVEPVHLSAGKSVQLNEAAATTPAATT